MTRLWKKMALWITLGGMLIASLAASDQALAAEPWWHVNAVSAPATTPGGEATVDLYISNVGDDRTDGTTAGNLTEYLTAEETSNFITVTDILPQGVIPTHVYAEGGGTFLGETKEAEVDKEVEKANKPRLCTISVQTVHCKYGTPVRPYEQIIVAVTVRVTPGAGGGENDLSVSGGGARPAVLHRRLALEPGLSESFGVQSYEVDPEEEGGAADSQAGSHPFQLTTSLVLNPQSAPGPLGPVVKSNAYAKDLHFVLPPGLLGNPAPLPKCSIVDFALEASSPGHCPVNTVVGVAVPQIYDPGAGPGHVPLSSTVPIFNLEPSIGEPARFGFLGSIYGPVVLDTSVRTGGGYNVVVTVPDITESVEFIGSQVTFWGVPADSRHDEQRGVECIQDWQAATGLPALSCPVKESLKPLLVMPTYCGTPLSSTTEGDSWSAPGSFVARGEYTFENRFGGQLKLDGCEKLGFEPSIKVAPDGQEAATPTGLTADVHLPQDAILDPHGDAESALKETTVTLPTGIGLDPSAADGLSACSVGQIGLDSPAAPTCQESSKIGTAEIKTPLLPPGQVLTGAVYLAQQDANPFGSLVAMYIDVTDPISGVTVKLAGEVKLNSQSGQLTSTFKETPPLPFEDAILHFFGGSRAPLGTPSMCGSYTTTASFVPWSGRASVPYSSQFLITSGPDNKPCSNPLPFSPTLASGSLNVQAGAFTPFTTTMSREDGNQDLKALQLRLPSGLSGLLPGVKLCGEAEADAGTCGPESLIGETTVSVGLGGSPYTVKGGKVYMTGPYEGAPFGLSIVNPAKAGPFDLGQVVVRAKVEVDPTTAALTITSDSTGPYAIPEYIDGIPLQIQHVNVTVNRSGFTFNPTSCARKIIGGTLTSTQNAVSGLSVPFQVTDCARLAFKPKFGVSTSGQTSRKRGASLRVKLSYPAEAPFGSQANIRSVKVQLPKQLPSRLETLKHACLDTVFNQNPAACPATSRVGSARATTPLLPVPLYGPAYFVSHGGAKFPELIVILSGYGVRVDLHGETFITKGITTSTFRTVPDVPVGTFELNLPEGPHSALAANGVLCGRRLEMPTVFTAQNGLSLKQATRIAVTNCGKKHGRGKKKGRARK